MRRGGHPSQARHASLVFTEPALCSQSNVTGILTNDTTGLGSCWTRSGFSWTEGVGRLCVRSARRGQTRDKRHDDRAYVTHNQQHQNKCRALGRPRGIPRKRMGPRDLPSEIPEALTIRWTLAAVMRPVANSVGTKPVGAKSDPAPPFSGVRSDQ